MTMLAAAAEPVRVLLIEDNPADADLIVEVLDDANLDATGGPRFSLVKVGLLAQGEQRLGQGDIGAVLLDLSLPDSQGLESFRRLSRTFPEVPVVVLSGLDDEVLAAQAVREGAQDYLVKGQVDAGVLSRSLRYAIERRRAETERASLMHEQGARAEAEATLREHSTFLATICHDLRTPLAAIRGQAQLLVRRLSPTQAPDPDQIRAGLEHIEDSTARIARMLDELLDVAQLQAGSPLELHRKPTDLVSLARRIVANFQASHEDLRLQLECSEPELIGHWDSPRLERVLDNLLANAGKYSPPDSEVVVTVEREASDLGSGWALLRVRDQGVGIPAEDQPHIFDRFYRGRNVAGRIGGTGVGLAGVRQIVEQHGGSVTVESREGAGSTFTTRLPLDTEE